MDGDAIGRPLANGATIPLSKDIAAEIFFAPFPIEYNSRVDIFAFEPQSGAAISDAKVTIKYSMPYMDPGIYSLNTVYNRNGHYQALLDIDSCGDLIVLDIHVGTGDQGGSVRLGVPAGQ